ncbi:hypothetical protein AX17_007042 [Amanita inopinata Kibby_2008]|nr:hypothetical protein AX17_007042 [Amanita inopinata Kibby_2008]
MAEEALRATPRPPVSIQSLSSEILSEIFLHCLSNQETTKSSQPPLLLCHICSKWRKIALSTPRLWRRLSIKPSTRYLSRDVVERRLIRLARFYVDNVKDCTMSLHLELVRAGSWAPESENNWRNLCNELLVRHINRYHEISIQAPEFELIQLGAFSRISAGQVHRLQSMKLHVRNSRQGDVIALLSSAPRLARVAFGLQDGYVLDDTWSNISQHFRPSLLPLPWGQLTHFCIHMSITLPVWYSLLPQLTSLEQCVILLDASDSQEENVVRLTNRPITLPSLTTLGITLISRDRPASFHGLEMPELNTLHLSSLFPMDIPTLQWQDQIDTLRNISSLCLHRVGIDSRRLIDLLGAMESLKDLILSCDLRDYDVILKALSVDETTQAPLVPQLQRFRLHVAFSRNATIHFTTETFVRMIQSRWWRQSAASVQQLRHVQLGVFGDRDTLSISDTNTTLAPLIQEGLGFKMHREPPLPYPTDEDITLMW